MTIRASRTWVILFGLFLAGWAVATFLVPYRLGYAGLDDWACFASGATARKPLGITAPLLGNFLGADHTWGVHWPGAPLLYSCLFAFVPLSALARVILFMVLGAGIAAITFLLLRRYFRAPLIAAAGALIILSDRELADLMGIARPEVLSALVLAALVYFLSRVGRARGRGGHLIGAGVCFFLLPLLHPVLVPLGGLLCVYAGWRAWEEGRTTQGIGLAVCYIAGLAEFASWFYFQPDALHQLEINGKANAAPFRWGGTFVAYLHFDPAPYMSAWLYLLALVGVAARWPFHRATGDTADNAPPPGTDWTLPVVTLLGGTASAQLFHNPCYQIILLPEAILLAIVGLQWLAHRWGHRETAAWIVPALFAFAAVHSAFLGVRTWKFFQTGRPNIRAEIHALVLSLPSSSLVLIPNILWEEGVRHPERFVLNTPPFALPREVSKAYEDATLQRVRPGDLLLVSGHDLVHLSAPPSPEQWEYIHHYEHRLPGKAFWGYDLTLYRRR